MQPFDRLQTGALVIVLTAMLSACTPEGRAAARELQSQSLNQDGLQLIVRVPQYEFQAGDEIPVQLSLQNTSSDPLSFLPINTAFEEPLQADVFDVTYEGHSVAYIGITANRLPPVAEDIITLHPGENVDRVVNLAEYYQLDVPGQYTIQYRPRQLVVEPRLQIELADAPSEADPLQIAVQ